MFIYLVADVISCFSLSLTFCVVNSLKDLYEKHKFLFDFHVSLHQLFSTLSSQSLNNDTLSTHSRSLSNIRF